MGNMLTERQWDLVLKGYLDNVIGECEDVAEYRRMSGVDEMLWASLGDLRLHLKTLVDLADHINEIELMEVDVDD